MPCRRRRRFPAFVAVGGKADIMSPSSFGPSTAAISPRHGAQAGGPAVRGIPAVLGYEQSLDASPSLATRLPGWRCQAIATLTGYLLDRFAQSLARRISERLGRVCQADRKSSRGARTLNLTGNSNGWVTAMTSNNMSLSSPGEATSSARVLPRSVSMCQPVS